MSVLGELIASYQDANPEQFNDAFIRRARSEDDISSYLEDISRALEVVEGIRFLGCSVDKDESGIAAQFQKGRFRLKVEESRLQLIRMNFRLTKGEETEDIELKLLFPQLVDGLYYIIDGSRYFSIWQVVDRATYVTSKTFSLKTLLMPIVFRTDKSATIALKGEPYAEVTGRLLVLDIFKNRRNVLNYYLAKFGLSGTIEYFNMEERISVVFEGDEDEFDEAEFDVADAGKAARIVMEKGLCDDDTLASFVVSLHEVLKEARGLTAEQAESTEYWLRRLGRFYTKNANSQLDKAERVMVSLERVLDDCTKKNLVGVPDDDKADVYAIMRWMIGSYPELSRADNMDLANKRIRMGEYLIHPLLMKFSENTYRLLNNQNVTLAKLKSAFKNIKPGFIIKRLLNNKLLRYSNLVSDLDLFGCGLKWSARGPQSLADGTKSEVGVRYRGVHPSYVGRIGLAAASSSDPGLAGTFVPFIQVDEGGFFQKDEQ